MKFTDIDFCKNERYAIGVEEEGGIYYLSIPVSNRMVDYEEYYKVSAKEFETFKDDLKTALPFVEKCRNREMDERLFYKPGSDRGFPS